MPTPKPKNPRSKFYAVRLPLPMASAVDGTAKAMGLTPSAFIRQALDALIRSQLRKADDR